MVSAQQSDLLLGGLLDASGDPYQSGTVTFYEAGSTTTKKSIWDDANKAVEATNPVTLDTRGSAAVYGDGLYQIVIKDSDGNTIDTIDNFQLQNKLFDGIDVRNYGTAGAQATISSALTALGASDNTLYLTRGTWSITSDLTFDSNVNLKMEAGAILSVATGVTVTINGPFTASTKLKCFALVGTGVVTFGTLVEQVYPEWWGAKRDGATDDATEIQNALTTAKRVMLSDGTYSVASALVATADVVGESWNTILKASVGNFNMLEFRTNTGIACKDFQLQGAETTGANSTRAIQSLSATKADRITIDNVYINGPSAGTGFSTGITLQRAQNCIVRNCKIRRLRGTASTNGVFLDSDLTAGGDIASAAALSLGATGNYFKVTGTTAITSISEGSNTNTVITLGFESALTVTHDTTNLNLIRRANITTEAAGDTSRPHFFLIFEKVSSGKWKQIPFHTQTCNNNIIEDNDIEFETDDDSSSKMGSGGIVVRAGGSFNIIRNNRIRHCAGAQISMISTTNFMDACRENVIMGNVLMDMDAWGDEVAGSDGNTYFCYTSHTGTTDNQPITGSDYATYWKLGGVTPFTWGDTCGYAKTKHDNLEAGIEIGGRMLDNVVIGNEIWRPKRIGILLNEDGTNKNHYRTICKGNAVYEAWDIGIWCSGPKDCIIIGNAIHDAGVAVTCDRNLGINILGQATTDNQTDRNVVTENLISGSAYTDYGIDINVGTAGNQPDKTYVYNNQIEQFKTQAIRDRGTKTRFINRIGPGDNLWTYEIVGSTSAADNTATAFAKVTVPVKACAGMLVLDYILNSTGQGTYATGSKHVTIGRAGSGTSTVVSVTSGNPYQTVTPSTTEGFTTFTVSNTTNAGGTTSVQTFSLTYLLDSDLAAAPDVKIHWRARFFAAAADASDRDAEITIATS